jgi:hypothetical protein
MKTDKRTDEKPYKSLCSELYVDAPNYIAELVCKRKQEKEGQGTLPIKFWNHPKYKNLYIREVSQARNLLKSYSEIAIIKSLEDYRSKFILSLRNKRLIPIIEEYNKQIGQKSFTEETDTVIVISKPLPNKTNILRRL